MTANKVPPCPVCGMDHTFKLRDDGPVYGVTMPPKCLGFGPEQNNMVWDLFTYSHWRMEQLEDALRAHGIETVAQVDFMAKTVKQLAILESIKEGGK